MPCGEQAFIESAGEDGVILISLGTHAQFGELCINPYERSDTC